MVTSIVERLGSICTDSTVWPSQVVTGTLVPEDDNAYGGVRVRLVAYLGPAKIAVQVDVGMGDAVTPAPEIEQFPALLDFPSPKVRAYPVYTVVAEKLEAMVKLGIGNTRMKDFYDVWILVQRFTLDGHLLREAIETTFSRR